jgi:hypothetical protein
VWSHNVISNGNWDRTGVKPDLPMDASNALQRIQDRLAAQR